MTDFMGRKEQLAYLPVIQKGISLHLQIDSFTDTHPASRLLRKILRKRHKKYAPVVVDLIWDYCLSANWQHYSGEALNVFAQSVYAILKKRKTELPLKMQLRIDGMIEADFLLAYASKERMASSLAWMDRRVRFPSKFTEALLDLEENEILIQDLFSQFFPEIISYVTQHCLCD
jgi:acyl carrier protein phosphodiesterase